jgi:hypothetical protein
VARFFFGFISATVLWAGLAFLYLNGSLDGLLGQAEDPAQASAAPADEADDGAGAKDKRRKVKRPRVQKRAAAAAQPRPSSGSGGGSGTGTSGDDIDWDGPRNVDMAGGEAQLAGTQIDAGFDTVMGKIRRCLILVESDGDVTGRLLFGMRVGGDGKVKAVNLTGPSVVTGGDAGGCLRGAAQAIKFPAFNGPDMLFKYPITLQ